MHESVPYHHVHAHTANRQPQVREILILLNVPLVLRDKRAKKTNQMHITDQSYRIQVYNLKSKNLLSLRYPFGYLRYIDKRKKKQKHIQIYCNTFKCGF